MFVTAIIAAGGRGRRFGAAEPKQLLAVGGQPILERSVRAFLAHPLVREVVVALPEELMADPPAYLGAARIVAGGPRRQDSVANGFRAAASESDIIVIHDAARPFASAALITRTIEAAAESGAALAALPARDTVKEALVLRPFDRLRAQDERQKEPLTLSVSKGELTVARTLPRETIFLAQTPQAFRRSVLADALRQADDATDEAALAERAGHRVRLVEGEASNIKITTAEDLPIAEAIARLPDFRRTGPARTGRAGTGYDLHRLVTGRPLILGGVTIPSEVGALGHSDADVVCHAITDAILGAAGCGDIGSHFPDTDPQWKGASSLDLLARAAAMVGERGFEVGNVDVTVILEKPKLRPHVEAMRQAVANAVGIDVERISVKGKTNEGVDAVGRGEAIAAHAIVLVRAIGH
jgi:2-C-methyl-D-erythritol 4-phosphate cytidylyltransferase/2-C-methyl-D-erythritol 2,4-cyclodiphosphate synthase